VAAREDRSALTTDRNGGRSGRRRRTGAGLSWRSADLQQDKEGQLLLALALRRQASRLDGTDMADAENSHLRAHGGNWDWDQCSRTTRLDWSLWA
jgi:hypothetical protein